MPLRVDVRIPRANDIAGGIDLYSLSVDSSRHIDLRVNTIAQYKAVQCARSIKEVADNDSGIIDPERIGCEAGGEVDIGE